jgi:2-dehydropantoate 2-reductase
MAVIEGAMRIGVLGPGAIGGLLAGLFWRGGYEVSCIGTDDEVSTIIRSGLRIDSPVFGSFIAWPDANGSLASPVDVLFITTKSPFLHHSLTRIAGGTVQDAVLLPLLNGVGHREVIRSVLRGPIAVGSIGSIEVTRTPNGQIRQLSRQDPHIDLAADSDVPKLLLEKISGTIRTVGVSVSILEKESEVVWKKLVRLNAIASLTAAYQEPVGVVRTDPELRELLGEIVREGARVALREGVEVKPEEVLARIDSLPEGLTTSLQRDIAGQAPSELESITGGVLRLANQYGIAAPAHERVYGRIGARLPPSSSQGKSQLTVS